MELDPQLRIVAKPGGILLFSGSYLHSTVPNTAGIARFSIDFRTVHLDDVVGKIGAPNIDSACTGTTLRDFLCGADLSQIPEELVRPYENPPPRVDLAIWTGPEERLNPEETMASQHKLSGQKVLVTGASGFIGSHLCRRLSENGADVHAVSRSQHDNDGARWWQADLSDSCAVRALLKDIRPQIIFHLSGQVTGAPDLEFAISTFDSNVVSTVYLLTAAAEIGCDRIVLTASMTEPQLSSADAIPGSPYGAAKWVSAAYGRMFHALYQTPVTIVRPFVTYGPRQNPKKIIPYVALSLLRGECPELASGRWEADWIYIDDVIEGCLTAA